MRPNKSDVVDPPMEDFVDPAELESLYGLSENDVIGDLRGHRVYLNRDGNLLLVLKGWGGARGAEVTLCPDDPTPGIVTASWSVTGRVDLTHEEVDSLASAAARQKALRAKLEVIRNAERAERDLVAAERRRVEAERIAEKDLFEIRGGSGYGHQQMEKGKVYRNIRFGIADGEPEYLFVLETEARSHQQDGMDFGVGAESGYSYRAVCRAAKKNEIKQLLVSHHA